MQFPNFGQPLREWAVGTTRGHAQGETLITSVAYCRALFKSGQGIFDTDFDKYTEDAIALFGLAGVNTVFENLEGFPMDWKTNAPAFIKFVREHQCPSFLEYGKYPFVSADEIKKALKIKNALGEMLDQMP